MPGSFDDTSKAKSIANTFASSTADVRRFNEMLTNQYVNRTFADWAANVATGRITNANPPKPPIGYRLSEPNPDGYQFYEVGTEPVCEMPPLPEDHSKPQAPPPADGDTKRNVGPGDTQPIGHIVEDADGTRWKKVQSKTPFGTAVYYERQ